MQLCRSQPSAHEEDIMKIKGKWTKRSDHNAYGDPGFPQKQSTIIVRKMDSLAGLLKEAYPNPIGLEAGYHVSFNERPLFEGGPFAYSLHSGYQTYYFNTHLNKILLGGETGTSVQIYVNSFGWFLTEEGEWMIGNKLTKVFGLRERDGEWKGLPAFKNEQWGEDAKMGLDRTILVTPDNKLPYLPLTQKEYLFALKQRWLVEKQKNHDAQMNQEKETLKIIEENRNNKNMSADMKQKVVASLEKDFDNYMKNRESNIQKYNEQFDKKIKLIDQYLSSHSEQEMEEAVATTSLWDFTGHFGPEGKKRVFYPVLLDSSYFKKNLPRDVPQFFVLYWTADKDAPALEFLRQFEDNFPLTKLKSFLYRRRENLKIYKPQQ